jgi:hypothetical protein
MYANNLSLADLEAIFDRLSEAIDTAGEDKAKLFLAKLAMISANIIADRSRFEDAIEIALRDLQPADGG